MEFGIFNSICMPPQIRKEYGADAEHRRLLDEIEYVKAADAAGFKYAWVTEHHFLEEYSHLSASESFIAYALAKTSNIHVGSGIFNITPPVNHPARIAERVAMLDHLSEGRFEFGTGRGSSTTEQRGFGIEDRASTDKNVAGCVLLRQIFNDSGCAGNGEGDLNRSGASTSASFGDSQGLV